MEGYVRFPENNNATFDYNGGHGGPKTQGNLGHHRRQEREAAAAGEAGSGNSNGFGLLASASVLILNKKAREEERVLALETMAVNLNKEENKNKNNNAWWNPFGKKSASDSQKVTVTVRASSLKKMEPSQSHP